MKKQITDIQIDEECPDRCTLFLNNQQFGVADSSLITKLGLRVGLEIEAEVLQKLIEADEVTTTKNSAINLLRNQIHSKQQLIDLLGKKGLSERAIDTTLADLEQLGFIKGENYARSWVDRRQRSKPRGKKVLKHELVSKGIDQTTADCVLNAIDDTDEAGIALQLARKQVVHYKSLLPHVAKRRMHDFLLRRGFDHDTIERVINQVLKR
jgi:regulatory protein